jgi:hypothetical protein
MFHVSYKYKNTSIKHAGRDVKAIKMEWVLTTFWIEIKMEQRECDDPFEISRELWSLCCQSVSDLWR